MHILNLFFNTFKKTRHISITINFSKRHKPLHSFDAGILFTSRLVLAHESGVLRVDGYLQSGDAQREAIWRVYKNSSVSKNATHLLGHPDDSSRGRHQVHFENQQGRIGAIQRVQGIFQQRRSFHRATMIITSALTILPGASKKSQIMSKEVASESESGGALVSRSLHFSLSGSPSPYTGALLKHQMICENLL